MSADTHKEMAGLDDAVSRAVGLLAKARLPLIAGLGTDVDGVRAALRLAHAVGGAVDHAAAAHVAVDLRVAADAGNMTTTAAEARNRADLLVIAGPGAAAFVERSGLFTVAETPYSWRGERQVLAIGCEIPRAISATAETLAIEGDVRSILRRLKARAGGRPAAADAAIEAAAAMLKAAKFGVVVADPEDFDRFGLELLHALVKELNETTRFSTLTLPAPHHGRGANLVSAWTTGARLRVGFGRGYPEQDDWRFDAERLARSGEVDALVWIGALGPDLPDWAADLATVALVPAGTSTKADVVIEVGVPGVDHDAVMTDVVRDGLSFVEASAPSSAPRVDAVIARIADALASRSGGE